MKIHVLSLTAVALVAAGCAGVAPTDSAKGPVFSHPRLITNTYLPLEALKQDVLVSKQERVERTAKPEVRKSFIIGGQDVDALAVEDREYGADGSLTEVTLDYFAQDDAGNVYYLGEDVDEYKNGQVMGHNGGWLLGRDTQDPGLLMPAHPQVGDKFRSENVSGITLENDMVVAMDESITTKLGTFQHCLKVKEVTSDGDTEYKLYAPNIGCVAEMESDGSVALSEHVTR